MTEVKKKTKRSRADRAKDQDGILLLLEDGPLTTDQVAAAIGHGHGTALSDMRALAKRRRLTLDRTARGQHGGWVTRATLIPKPTPSAKAPPPAPTTTTTTGSPTTAWPTPPPPEPGAVERGQRDVLVAIQLLTRLGAAVTFNGTNYGR